MTSKNGDNSGFLSFFDFCSAHQLLMCLFSVCHSQGNSFAYFCSFMGAKVSPRRLDVCKNMAKIEVK